MQHGKIAGATRMSRRLVGGFRPNASQPNNFVIEIIDWASGTERLRVEELLYKIGIHRNWPAPASAPSVQPTHR
ncbi:hypothetical protein Tamer19_08330 [Cupriavidus sp. TA19]|nr:hypothetical protein Tamer19_08330 [Cupriavidus sp. TA19]